METGRPTGHSGRKDWKEVELVQSLKWWEGGRGFREEEEAGIDDVCVYYVWLIPHEQCKLQEQDILTISVSISVSGVSLIHYHLLMLSLFLSVCVQESRPRISSTLALFLLSQVTQSTPGSVWVWLVGVALVAGCLPWALVMWHLKVDWWTDWWTDRSLIVHWQNYSETEWPYLTWIIPSVVLF